MKEAEKKQDSQKQQKLAAFFSRENSLSIGEEFKSLYIFIDHEKFFKFSRRTIL